MTEKLYLMRGSAPCRLVHWVALLADHNLELVDIDLMKGEHKQDWFMRLNPRHCVPTYQDGELVLSESRAIAQYLVSKTYRTELGRHYPGIWGQFFLSDKAKVNEMLYYDIGTLYKRIGEFIYPIIFRGEKPNKDKFDLVRKSLGYLDHKINENGGFLCGTKVSLADLSVALSLTMLEFFEPTKDFQYTPGMGFVNWHQKMKNLPHWEEVNAGFYAWLKSKKG
jgi:glutathione S-transferase